MAKQAKIIDQRNIQSTLDIVSKGKPFKIVNTATKRDFNKDTVTLGDIADVFGTLVKELIAKGIING